MKRKSKTLQDIRKKRICKLIKMNNYDITHYKKILDDLLKKPLIKQRTPEWFKLREDRLTASDLGDAIKNPVSLARKKLKGNTFISSSIPALKWGTMYEAMAIRIYSNQKKTKVHEFGLIINDDIKNFGASPDGITDEGIMIEIKCPYTRQIIDGKIPEKYYYQMQGQLAVCKLNKCEYIECEFIQFEDEEEFLIETNKIKDIYLYGIIAEKKNKTEYDYIYSSDGQNNIQDINEMKKYESSGYKLNYWKLKNINIQEVSFDENDWNSVIKNKIEIYNDIYLKEKESHKSINMFINDDE